MGTKNEKEIYGFGEKEYLTEEYLDECDECKQTPLFKKFGRTLLKVEENQNRMEINQQTMMKNIKDHGKRLKTGDQLLEKLKTFKIQKEATNGKSKEEIDDIKEDIKDLTDWKSETNKILGRLSIAFVILGIMGTAFLAINGYLLLQHLQAGA